MFKELHGSGKTTIALHRIAYLIYNYDKNFFPEEFLIIAPSKFFLNYISNVLPDLGVERVQQSTYEDIAFEIIGDKFDIEEPNNKLARIIDNNKSEKEAEMCRIIESASMLKSSIRFKNLIDEYLYEVEKRFVPDADFKIDKYVFMKKEDIHHLYYKEYGNLPISRRIEEITKHLKNSVMMRSGEILKDIEEERDYKIAKVKNEEPIEEIRLSMIRNIYGDSEKLAKSIVKDAKKHALNYFGANKIMSPIKYYKEFIDVYLEQIVGERIDKREIKYIKDSFAEVQRKGKIEMEDIAPLMYIKCMVHGIKTKFELKHIVIDEAQDFSEFQFYVFKKIVKSNSMTILGDLSQGIYYYRGTRNWEKTMNIVFGEDSDLKFLTLKKTYRTTEEIMNLANHVISNIRDILNCELGEPVMKNGAPVTIKKYDSRNDMILRIKQRLEEFKEKGFTNIAIIGKTIPDCLKLKEELNDDTIHMINSKDSEYNGGINIVPSYLSKGLEFDAVIITDADIYNYTKSEVDTKLLYVCITRAMNTLDIYHVEEISELLG